MSEVRKESVVALLRGDLLLHSASCIEEPRLEVLVAPRPQEHHQPGWRVVRRLGCPVIVLLPRQPRYVIFPPHQLAERARAASRSIGAAEVGAHALAEGGAAEPHDRLRC